MPIPRFRREAVVVTLVLALAAVPVAAQAPPFGRNHAELEKHLQGQLERALHQGRQTLADVDRGAPASLDGLIALFDLIRADDLLIRERATRTAGRLESRGASGTVLDRQTQMTASYAEQMDRILRQMDDVLRGARENNAVATRQALEVLIRELAQLVAPPDRTPLAVSLPYRSLNLPQVEPQAGPGVLPAYADIRIPAPTAADLAGSPEALLTPEIVAQARALRQNPIAIFEFVQNQQCPHHVVSLCRLPPMHEATGTARPARHHGIAVPYSSFLNSSTVRPASCTMPPIV